MMGDNLAGTSACVELGPRLAALLDDELTNDEHDALVAHVHDCPLCATAVAWQRRTQAALRDLAASLHAPPSLGPSVQARLRHADGRVRLRQRLEMLGGLAAALVILVVAGRILQQRQSVTTPALVLAARAHQAETLGSAPVSFASADPNAVGAWASTVAKAGVDVPSFAQNGYRLIGARAEPSFADNAVTLVYDGRRGRISCVIVNGHRRLGGAIASPASTPAIHYWQADRMSAAGWWEGDTAYLLAGDLQPATLVALAQLAAAQE